MNDLAGGLVQGVEAREGQGEALGCPDLLVLDGGRLASAFQNNIKNWDPTLSDVLR